MVGAQRSLLALLLPAHPHTRTRTFPAVRVNARVVARFSR